VGIHDAYYTSIDTGQRFFLSLRMAAGNLAGTSMELLGEAPS